MDEAEFREAMGIAGGKNATDPKSQVIREAKRVLASVSHAQRFACSTCDLLLPEPECPYCGATGLRSDADAKSSSDDAISALLITPYRELAQWHSAESKGTWLPWRRWRHEGFALGLIAAIELIETLREKSKGASDLPSEFVGLKD